MPFLFFRNGIWRRARLKGAVYRGHWDMRLVENVTDYEALEMSFLRCDNFNSIYVTSRDSFEHDYT